MSTSLSSAELAALRGLDTCTVANAIETFAVRLRNEGYADARIRSVFPALPPMVGYAAPVRIRCSNPPPTRGGAHVERADWWSYLLTIPAPRVVVIEDADEKCGAGAFLGEVHAAILQTLGCVGVVTNGAVRDVPAIEALRLPLFAGSLAVSHAYVHVVDVGCPVEIGGLAIAPGDLLHGDCHGVLSVPVEIAAAIPAVAQRLVARERKVLDLCRAGKSLTIEELQAAVQGVFD